MSKIQKSAVIIALAFVLYRTLRFNAYDELLSFYLAGMLAAIAIRISTRPRGGTP